MAVRSVTAYDLDYSTSDISTGQIVAAADVDRTFNNQWFAASHGRVLLSWFDRRYQKSIVATVFEGVHFQGHDLMGSRAANTLDAGFYGYTWADGTISSYTLRITITDENDANAVTGDLVINSSVATPSWRDWGTVSNALDGTTLSQKLKVEVTAVTGAGVMYLTGGLVFSIP